MYVASSHFIYNMTNALMSIIEEWNGHLIRSLQILHTVVVHIHRGVKENGLPI